MSRVRRPGLSLASRLIVAILAVATVPDVLAETEPDTVRLPEVVVEAEEFQGLPAAVTSFGAESIESAGIDSVQDLPLRVPNLALSDGGTRSFGNIYSIRGLANTQLFSDPSVALYVDDVPFGGVFTYSADLLNIERIDVYRGPQGTRFGRNSEAGVIDITTRQPTNHLTADGAISAGSFDSWYYRAGISGPIVKDVLGVSLGGAYAQSDGFVRNEFLHTDADSQEGLTGRATLRWIPADGWDIRATATLDKFDDGVRIVPLSGDPHTTFSDFPAKSDVDANSQSLRISHAEPDFTVTSITARRDWRLDPLTLDLDLSSNSIAASTIRQSQEQWTEELRVQSPPGHEGVKWLAGFFFSSSETKGDSLRDFLAFGFSERTRHTLDESTYAAFGQLTYTVRDRLTITPGIRFDLTESKLDRVKTSTLGSSVPVSGSQDFFNVAPKLTLSSRINDNLLLYASTGIGFKPGGFTAFTDDPGNAEFDSETSWVNEIGIKSSFWNDKLLADVAVFYYDIWDYQVERSITGTTDLTIFNAPETISLGAELEVIARPVRGLELSAAVGYTHAEFERFHQFETGANLAGNRPPFVPEYTLSAAAQYTHRSGLFGRIEVLAQGETFFDEANTPAFRQSSYAVLNARIGWQTERLSIYLYATNLTDTDYFTKKIPEIVAGVPGEPQSFGAMLIGRY